MDLVSFRPGVVIRYDESSDRVFLIAVGASDVGAVLICLRAVFAGQGPGLEETELFSAVGTEVSACSDLQVVVDPGSSLLGSVPNELTGRDGLVVAGLIGIVRHVQFPFAAAMTSLILL